MPCPMVCVLGESHGRICSNVSSWKKQSISRNTKKICIIEAGKVKDSMTPGEYEEPELYHIKKAHATVYFHPKRKGKPLMSKCDGNVIAVAY